MGLDCTAYKNLQIMDDDDVIYEEYLRFGKVASRYPTNGVNFFINENFPTAALDIEDDKIYSFEKSISWRAGSYSSYSDWRNWLANVAGYQSIDYVWNHCDEGDPFYELLHFSDCDGTLGTKVCKKLLNDFIKFEENLKIYDKDEYKYYLELYQTWKTALTYAAENGAISFH